MAMVINAVSYLAVAFLLATVANATTHYVDWRLGINYKAWAAANPIRIGDSLVFSYLPGYHSVLQVSKQDYDSCRTSNPISAERSGSTLIVPYTPGLAYIICGTPGHCEQGMKLELNILGYDSYGTPPPPARTYSYSPPAVTYSPPTETYPKPNSAHRFSSAGSFALIVALMAMCAI